MVLTTMPHRGVSGPSGEGRPRDIPLAFGPGFPDSRGGPIGLPGIDPGAAPGDGDALGAARMASFGRLLLRGAIVTLVREKEMVAAD